MANLVSLVHDSTHNVTFNPTCWIGVPDVPSA